MAKAPHNFSGREILGTPAKLPSYAQITAEGWGFQSIVRAIERCLLVMDPTLKRRYAWNFQGITEALWDLSEGLAGHLAMTGVGPLPPGWGVDPDTGQPIPIAPRDGSFWFDTRQGRLFVSISGQWYQTNGAESQPWIDANPPIDPATGLWSEKPGRLWLCTLDGRLYIYVGDPQAMGEPGWFELSYSSGGVSP